jgi:hypothetical protein
MERVMRRIFLSFVVLLAMSGSVSLAQQQGPLLGDKDTMLLTVFLKHDQSMNNVQRRALIDESGFRDMFPPVMRFPPDHLRRVNLAIENGAWGAYQTEFYVTYDLAAARKAAANN